jgi:hypothetical protein
MAKLKVSISTYNEIASLLELQGIKLGENNNQLILEKDTQLLSPIDYRLVTIRRDVADIAAKSYNIQNIDNNVSFVEYVNELFNFVLKGEIPQKQTNTLTIERITDTSEGLDVKTQSHQGLHKTNPNWK